MNGNVAVLSRLMAVIEDRKKARPAGSYTVKLLDGGLEKIGAKILEEAAEVVEAAGFPAAEARPAVVHEAADLIYHLCVLLAWSDVGLGEVTEELRRRFKEAQ